MPDPAPHPAFADPPVIETRLGIQFSPLNGLYAGHFGLFWRECLGEGWTLRPDGQLQPHRAELFGTAELTPVVDLEDVNASPVRMTLADTAGRRLVQFQPDQLAMSFSRGKPDCPRYSEVRAEFGQLVSRMIRFASDHDLPAVVPDLWDVAYVNVVPSGDGELWQTPADWHRVFPKLFPQGVGRVGDCEFGTFDAAWYYNLPGHRGRVHIKASKSVARRPAAATVANFGSLPVLLLVLTVRGAISAGTSWSDGLDYGHEVVGRVFHDLASHEALSHWGFQS